MVGQATLFESSVPLTVAQVAHLGMCTRRAGDRPEVFPVGERYGILAVPRGDPGGRS
jgi:hypothetical protein